MARYQIDNRASPVDFSGGDMLGRTLQNAKNLLMTRMGEVPYDRQRGFDPSLYDMPLPLLNEELGAELDRVLAYEPDAELVEAEATIADDGSVYIKAIIEVDLED